MRTTRHLLQSFFFFCSEARLRNVLDHPEFAPIFAPGSRAEVSLAGHGGDLPSGLYLNAQIDRLAVTDDHVYIVDYKSNRPPPTVQEEVPDACTVKFELEWCRRSTLKLTLRSVKKSNLY